jgi:uncharacterized membrane protein SpoIIM required for sporulation
MEMKHLPRVSQAFVRTSSVICAVILLSVAVELASTAYHSLTYERSSFEGSAEVQNYENRIENQIKVMSEWDLTKYYWKNNLAVAGYRVLFTPWYIGVSSEVYQSYVVGVVNTYILYRENALAPFRAAIETHGLLEMTGFFIISAITARLAWNLWKGLAHLMAASTKKRKPKLKKSKARIKEILGDFLILASIGFLMIFLAAPIEAYISPWVWEVFDITLVLPYVFLTLVALFYITVFFVQFRGLEMMKKDAKKIRTDIKSLLKGKFVPAHLSLLMFILFTIPAIIIILM